MSKQIIKPKNDNYEYHYKELSNGLKILLISDPKADKSAASLSVNVGSLVTPKEFQGLPHFCEHMLFMGTEKYPDESSYRNFIIENGGSANGYTSSDVTNYFFAVSNDAFDEALDRFSQSFVKPLFKRDAVQREMNAVNSEHLKNIESDDWRFNQLILSEAKENSVFNHFATGSLETLNKPNIREALLEYYNKYYSSDRMALCVLSNKSIDELDKIVTNLFNAVPKREKVIIPKYDINLPYDSSNLQRFYKIVPTDEDDSIKLVWFLDNTHIHYKSNPLSFLEHLFENEGKNSLSSSLIKDDLVIELSAYGEIESNTYSTFTIEAFLTPKGLKEYKTVIYRILYYIQLIQSKELNEEFFKEKVSKLKLEFDNMSKQQPIENVEELSKNMFLYDIEDILCQDQLIQKYSPELIKKYLNALKLTNLNVYLLSQSLEDECTLKEKWYGTKFNRQPLSDIIKLNEISKHKCSHKLDYPPRNEFIPTNFDLIPKSENDTEYPIEIFKDYIHSIWYKKDNSYQTPKVQCKALIKRKKDVQGLSYKEQIMLSDLWKKIIDKEMSELVSMANLGSTCFNISPLGESLNISISGFNSVVKTVMTKILRKFVSIEYNDKDDQLKLFCETEKQQMANRLKIVPYRVAEDFLNKLIRDPSITYDEAISILNKNSFTGELLEKYAKESLKQLKNEWLIMGNITKEEAIELGLILSKELKEKPEKLSKENSSEVHAVKLKAKSNYVFRYKNVSPNETNSALISFYQCGHLSLRENCILGIIFNMLRNRFFDELRTKKSLGYVVYMAIKEIRGNTGIMCCVQSSEKLPEEIAMIIYDFFTVSKKEVADALTQEQLSTYINSILVQKKKSFISLDEEFNFNQVEMERHEFMFDRKKKYCEILEKGNITIKEVQDFFNKHLINNISRLDVEYVSHKHWEANEVKLKENNSNIKREAISSIEEFKNKNEKYPDFYNLN